MLKSIFLQIARDSHLEDEIAERILMRITWMSRESLFLIEDIHPSHLYSFQKYIHDIKSGIPEAYIFWEQEFLGRNFYTDSSTLIPRPETELLVEILRNNCFKGANMSESSYIDVGTGSWCILASLLLELHPLRFFSVYWVDIDQAILRLTQKNLDRHKLWVSWLLEGSLLSPFLEKEYSLGKHLYISANLPYIRHGDSIHMWENVIKYEPSSALYGGKDTWFELYEKLIGQCFILTKIRKLKKIHLIIEIWYDQYEYTQKFLWEHWLRFEFFQDMHTIQRVVYIHGF